VALYVSILSFSFFFSSRRRHTRFSRDWSSDVCSSDLVGILSAVRPEAAPRQQSHYPWSQRLRALKDVWAVLLILVLVLGTIYLEIGRASCRERVWLSTVCVSLTY